MIKKIFMPVELLTGLTVTEILILVLIVVFLILCFKGKRRERNWWK